MLCATLLSSPTLLAETINDPMRPSWPGHSNGAASRPSQPTHHLDSIIIAPNHRRAVINGQLLTEGERIGATQLVRIEATQVILRTGSHSEVLTLLPVSIKSPSSEAQP